MPDPTMNPYLALLQQQEAGPPSWAQILQHIGNLGFGLAGGFGQAAATGQPTMAAIGPGLMAGNQLNAQAAHQAEQERMKRLEWQFKAQEHEDKRAEMLRNQAAIDAYVKAPGINVAPQQGPLMGPQPQGPTTGDAASRISGIESGGRYDAVGPVANRAGNRAYGKYQVMDFNIGPWTQEVLGKPMTPQEFLADTKAQDAVFNAKFGAYQQKYGSAGAARAWFAGEGGMNNPNAKDVLGTSVADYERKFTGGQPAPQVAQGDAAPTQPPPPPPRPGPTLSALPAFEGPGMGTIQPGALPEGVQPRIVPPPQVAQGDSVTPSGAPIDRNAPPPQFMQTGPGGPNVVQAQATPGPNTPPMAPTGGGPAPGGIAAPPTFVPPPMRDIPPEVNAQINRLVGLPRGVGLTIQQAEEKKHQLRVEQWRTDTEAAKAQHATALEVYKQQEESRRHERGLTEQKAAEQRKLQTELVTVRDRTTNEFKSVTKAEAVAGVSSGQFIPLDAESAKRAEEAAVLARENAARAAANQDVNIDPATGQPVINEKAVEAKTRISAAQGTDQSSKIQFELAQDAIKRNSDWQKTGAAAGSTIRNMAIFNKLSDEVKTGKYAGATTDLKAALKGAGVNLEAWGIPDNVAPAQAMQMMSQRFALEMRQEMPGPMSDGDRKFMERGSISIENDPNANKIMATWIKGNAERAQDRAKFAREYIRSGDFKTDPAGIDDYVEQKLAGKDYFDHSVLPKEAPAAKTGWQLERERRGDMNSAKPR